MLLIKTLVYTPKHPLVYGLANAWMKMVLFTKLQYFLSLVEGSVSVLPPSKARNMVITYSLLNMHIATTFVLCMHSNCQPSSATKIRVVNYSE